MTNGTRAAGLALLCAALLGCAARTPAPAPSSSAPDTTEYVTRKYQGGGGELCVESRSRDASDRFSRTCVEAIYPADAAWWRRQVVGRPVTEPTG